MGRRADKKAAKADAKAEQKAAKNSKAAEFSDSAMASVRKGAHNAVDTAEDFFGTSKRKTKKARKKVDSAAVQAEKKLAKMGRRAERKAERVRAKAARQVEKVTDKLPD